MANVKFSQFTDQATLSATSYVVGYDGATNVRADIQSLASSFAPYTVSVDALLFDLTPTASPGSGQIAYQGTTGTLSYNLNNSAVRCDIGQQLYAYVHNSEGAPITKGQAVYLFGANGNKASVKLANNTSDATSAKTLGLAAENIGANQNGMIICQGVIEGVSTTGFPDGTSLYLGASGGSLTSTKPYAPAHMVYIGTVETGNSNSNGKIYVNVQNGYELNEIHDVDLISVAPVNNDVLTYVTGSPNLWKPRSISSILGYTPQNQSIAAYSMLVNNTNAAAAMTTTSFVDSSGTYTGTIAWTGTAPTGTTNHTYRYVKTGNLVTLTITLVYQTAGSGLTNVAMEIPSAFPQPAFPAGVSGANAMVYAGSSQISGTFAVGANQARCYIRRNAADTGFELFSQAASGAYRYSIATCQYYVS